MKRLKQVTALLLAAVMVGTMLTGCGSKQGKKAGGNGKQTDIEIGLWNSGLGEQWLKDVIAAFNEVYPEYNVFYTASASASTIKSTFDLDDNTVDLYFTSERYQTEKLEPLDDILEVAAPGDKIPLGEKFNENYLKTEKASDGHYYQLTFGGGVIGFIYNKELFKKAGIQELPRTTNELAIVCDKLYSSKITPICHFKGNAYYDFLSEALTYQYDGAEYSDRFWTCTDEKGNAPSRDVFLQKDGRYEVLKAYEKILTAEYVMEGSNSIDHVTAQTQFLNDSAAMMVNGSWVSNEMASTGATMDKFAMMRTPVLSSLVEQLSTVKSDGQLRKVISAIDSVADGKKQLSDYQSGSDYSVDGLTVSAADWNRISNARFTVPTNYAGATAYIPNYSDNIEGAKKFLSFLYSDAGYKVYAETLKCPMPLRLSDGGSLDYSSWSDFQKSQAALLEEAAALPVYNVAFRHPIFITGGASKFVGINYSAKLSASNKSDRKTAEGIWEELIATVNDSYENKWLANIK